MTDNEIIKALECCADEISRCYECPYESLRYSECYELITRNAFDLINRQKAEIERLQSELSIWKDIAHRETIYVSIAKAEAVKEFAERLKEELEGEYIKATNRLENAQNIVVSTNIKIIDNLVKEMVGENND